MKVYVSEKSITIHGDPEVKGTPIIVIDDIMTQISEQTGDKWLAGKIAGYWVISQVRPEDGDVKWRPVFGGHEQPRSRKFTKALAEATGRGVTTLVEA